jgi:RNA polymerase subunit RPABC4/transcription elongation factor Spt4
MDLVYRTCSNCFACTGCEIYTCPGCGTELIVKSKKEARDS